jgi:integrase
MSISLLVESNAAPAAPELADWGRAHSDVPRLAKGTINKLIGGVQAVVVWARDQGVIPDDVQRADPFAKMRLEEDQSERQPFNTAELTLLFATPVFTAGERPTGGRGEAAYWLPLLGLFTGARRGEIAGLTAADVSPEETSGHPVIVLAENKRRNRSLKTPSSARTIPLHPELIRLRFMDFVEDVRRAHGDSAWLFPEIAPDRKGGASAWTKWFSRYIRGHGINDKNNVFHSLRHNFKDALRAAKVPEDLNDALTGQELRRKRHRDPIWNANSDRCHIEDQLRWVRSVRPQSDKGDATTLWGAARSLLER